MEIRVTDAPADNKDVEAVFVTVTSVKVDGQTVSGFEGPKTINIMALTNGKSELLASQELEARTYQNISLELDYDMDEDGNSPGSYVKTANGTKHKLSSGAVATGEYTFKGTSRLMADATSTVVLDFDLRKFIKKAEGQGESDFTLASKSELNGYLRFTDKSKAGSVKGTYDGEIESEEKVIVYAYKKGTFNETTETSSNASIQFKNAVASTEVDGFLSKSFKFHMLEEGDYEFHFASYRQDASGEMQLEGMIEAEGETNAELLKNITIQAGVELSLSVIANGVIGQN